MILYVDTSALVKLYVEETDSPSVRTWVEAASAVLTVRIAYAEARAAFARLRREGALTRPQLRRLVTHLDEDWSRYSIIEATESVVRRAGVLAERYALRGYDAVHLAAALEARGPGGAVTFACFDAKLGRAARQEGLEIPGG